MKRNFLVAVLVLLLFCFTFFADSWATSLPKYTITDLGTLGGSESFAYAINDSGQIVGYSRYPGDAFSGPFLWSKGEIVDINALYGLEQGYYAGMVENINNLGQMVGNSSDGHTIVLSEGVVTDLGTFGGAYSTGLSINNFGQIVGYYALPYGHHHAFQYGSGVMTPLGPFTDGSISVAMAINDSGVIVGMATFSPGPSHAFLYKNGVMTDISPFGSSESYAEAINNRGQVVGEFLTQDNGFHCFLYSEGEVHDLGTLEQPDCAAFAINEQEELVGVSPVQVGTEEECYYDEIINDIVCYKYPVYSWHGFLYKDGKMSDLNTLIPSNSGWEIYWTTDINNRGQIVGYGTVNGVDGIYRAFLLTPIREVPINIKPSSINFKNKGKIRVAIFSTLDFDPTSEIDQDSLTFGSTGDEQSLAFCEPTPKKAKGNGAKKALICHFYTRLTGFKCGDKEGILKGNTIDGMPIAGKDSVSIIPCKGCARPN